MEIKRIIDIERHRNGVAGAPFHVILFKDRDAKSSRKVAVVFDDTFYVAFDIDQLQTGNITFGQNSWRGDLYEPELRKAIADRDFAITQNKG